MTPAQPNQAQYPISDLDLFTDFPDRASYLKATGMQAPPFDVTKAIKGWTDPAPTGQPYNVFDEALGQIVEMAVPATDAGVNLPGAYTYATPPTVATDAWRAGPFNLVAPGLGLVDPSTVCLQADALNVAAQLSPIYGVTLQVALEAGMYYNVYGLDPRRQWFVVFPASVIAGPAGPSGSTPTYILAQTLIAQQATKPTGHWTKASNGGSPAAMVPLWVYDSPTTTAPAGAVPVPVPLRALLPDEVLFQTTGTPFQAATWMIRRTDLSLALTLAALLQYLATYNAQTGIPQQLVLTGALPAA